MSSPAPGPDPYHHPRPPGQVDYRHPATPPARSQWLTDDQAFGGCLVYGLLAGSIVLAILGAIGGLIWWLLTGT